MSAHPATRIDLDALTILRAHNGRRLTKTFSVATNGQVHKADYDSATWFAVEARPVGSIHELHRELLQLEADPHACVIRGAPLPGINLACTRRTKSGTAPAFFEVPRQWVMLDVDGLALPSASLLHDPEDVARRLLDLLAEAAPELQGVSAICQFSSSAGLSDLAEAEAAAGLPPRWGGVVRAGISMHVWFWLQTACSEAELKRWRDGVLSRGLTLDPATLRTVQPHYVAAPLFGDPLRDPLAGRRTVLVLGAEAAAELEVPSQALPRPHLGGGDMAHSGHGFTGWLYDIGGGDGFRQPMQRAIGCYIASNWPDPDLGVLKAAIRQRIDSADPGGRPDATLTTYASDAHLDALIAWTTAREAEKRASQHAAEAPALALTFPDRGVSLGVAAVQAGEAVSAFADRIRQGEHAELLLRMSVGAGKSEAAVQAAGELLDAAHAGGREGALFYFVPRHDLGAELQHRVSESHPGLKVGTWRGQDWVSKTDPGDVMCLDRELPRAARAAGLAGTVACGTCSHNGRCAFTKQTQQEADVWLLAHNNAFGRKPAALPPAAVAVVDEAFLAAAVHGTDKLHPVLLPVAALLDERTGNVTGLDRQRLLFLRGLAARTLEGQDAGGISRQSFTAAGWTAEGAREWSSLEWQTKLEVKLSRGMERPEVLARLHEAAAQGFTRLRPMLARMLRELLEGEDARSATATLAREQVGDVIRFEWRQDFAEWVGEAPKLLLDATTQPEVIRQWLPALEVLDIEVQAPAQWVRQITGRECSRTFFTQNDGNVRRLADLVTVELAQVEGEVLVVAQQAVELLLREEMTRRLRTLPARLLLTHHGALTGLDCYRNAEAAIVVGRPAVSRLAGERLAEIIRGGAVDVLADGEASRWETVTAGIRRPNGTGTPVRQPTHHDPLVEAVRWSISEGAVLQAIGRPRGVQRPLDRPVRITVLGEFALPLTVAEVVTWEDGLPDRLDVAAAEASLAGRALPLAPADLSAARIDLWRTPKAAELFLSRRRTPHPLIKKIAEALYKELRGPVLTLARYRKAVTARSWSLALVPVQAGRTALEAALGGPVVAYDELPPLSPPPAAPAPPPPEASAAAKNPRNAAQWPDPDPAMSTAEVIAWQVKRQAVTWGQPWTCDSYQRAGQGHAPATVHAPARDTYRADRPPDG